MGPRYLAPSQSGLPISGVGPPPHESVTSQTRKLKKPLSFSEGTGENSCGIHLAAIDLRSRQEARVTDRLRVRQLYALWSPYSPVPRSFAIAGCESDGYPDAHDLPNGPIPW